MEFDETKEHLGELISQVGKDGVIDEEDLRVQIFHIITHLNRIWNSKEHVGEIMDSKFPKTFSPIG